MSNFAAIGFDGDTPDDVQRLVAEAVERARPAPELGAAGHGHLLWQDDSGAAVAVHLRGKDVACVTPFFVAPDGGTSWQVRTSGPHLDKQCVHCSGADCDVLENGELVTRAAVQWQFFQPYHSWLKRAREFQLQLAGFTSALSLCASHEELARAQDDYFGRTDKPESDELPVRLADQAFLPYGAFESEGNMTGRARALLTGRVESVSTRTNSLTRRPFTHLRIVTLGGPLDVVAPLAVAEGATLALADVWLVGRPCEPPPMPEPRSWLKKLVGS